LRPQATDGVDMVVVRENVGGLYFGRGEHTADNQGRSAVSHTFTYSSDEVSRIVEVAVRLARHRRQRLALVVKLSGVPVVSQLWCDVFSQLTAGEDLQTSVFEVDNANYQLIAAAQTFDVVVAPNLFGDIISDAGALLLGSRGMSFSGNFGAPAVAVYQTGHGAAHDIAGQGIANPLGQILSAAFMLRESFGLTAAAAAIESAVEQTLAAGFRTADIALPGGPVISTLEMGRRIADTLSAPATTTASVAL
jgi:3-isopropylmalate dehydrogenase